MLAAARNGHPQSDIHSDIAAVNDANFAEAHRGTCRRPTMRPSLARPTTWRRVRHDPGLRSDGADSPRGPRFANNPFLRDRNIRFYAGAPLRTESGHVIGYQAETVELPRRESAQSRGSETNGRRERISGLGLLGAVRGFSREARGYWASLRARKPQRKLVAEALAEGEELGSNGLLICRPVDRSRESD